MSLLAGGGRYTADLFPQRRRQTIESRSISTVKVLRGGQATDDREHIYFQIEGVVVSWRYSTAKAADDREQIYFESEGVPRGAGGGRKRPYTFWQIELGTGGKQRAGE